MIKRVDLINQLCRKCKIRREDHGRSAFSKKELLLMNSAVDLLLHHNEKESELGDVPPTSRE